MSVDGERIARRLEAITNGRFEIIAELGRGGFGVVYLAFERALARRVAIKVLSPAGPADESTVGRFYKEAQTQAALEHPNIVTVYGVHADEQYPSFVMQYVRGRSLQHLLRSQGENASGLSIGAVQSLIYQIGDALSFAHHSGVIHRDVKPANILLGERGDPVVTDFGIAKVISEKTGNWTAVGIGTPAYISPEQFQAQRLTPAADQYSLGVLCFELFTGMQPFSGGFAELYHAHVNVALPRVRSLRADCPPEIDQVIARMTAKRPIDRFPSIEAALQELGARPLGLSDSQIRIELTARADVQRADEELQVRIGDGNSPSLRPNAGALAGNPRSHSGHPQQTAGSERHIPAEVLRDVIVGASELFVRTSSAGNAVSKSSNRPANPSADVETPSAKHPADAAEIPGFATKPQTRSPAWKWSAAALTACAVAAAALLPPAVSMPPTISTLPESGRRVPLESLIAPGLKNKERSGESSSVVAGGPKGATIHETPKPVEAAKLNLQKVIGTVDSLELRRDLAEDPGKALPDTQIAVDTQSRGRAGLIESVPTSPAPVVAPAVTISAPTVADLSSAIGAFTLAFRTKDLANLSATLGGGAESNREAEQIEFLKWWQEYSPAAQVVAGSVAVDPSTLTATFRLQVSWRSSAGRRANKEAQFTARIRRVSAGWSLEQVRPVTRFWN